LEVGTILPYAVFHQPSAKRPAWADPKVQSCFANDATSCALRATPGR
jgi:hypothetical protein